MVGTFFSTPLIAINQLGVEIESRIEGGPTNFRGYCPFYIYKHQDQLITSVQNNFGLFSMSVADYISIMCCNIENQIFNSPNPNSEPKNEK